MSSRTVTSRGEEAADRAVTGQRPERMTREHHVETAWALLTGKVRQSHQRLSTEPWVCRQVVWPWVSLGLGLTNAE